jgi:membrane protein YqaA with SNARE-associated domain
MMLSPAKKIYSWASSKAHSPHSHLWLGLIFLLELVLFVPLDAILMLFCLENPQRRYLYAGVATLASLFSGVAGYMLGLWTWETISPYVIGHFISADFFSRICAHYTSHQNIAVFIGSLVPFPFKAVALSAGVCQIFFFPFIASVFVARWLRFFLLAKMVQKWGVQMKAFADRHSGRIVLAFGAKIAIAFTFFWVLSQA